jgi:hypothetical protein
MHTARLARRLLLLGVLASLAGCATPAPSAPIATPSISVGRPSPTPALATPAPSTTTSAGMPGESSPPAASPTASGSAAGGDLGLTIHTLPEAWAVKTGPAVASDGSEIVWSAIASFDNTGQPLVPDIVSFTPSRDAEPRIIYRHPDRDSMIWDVAVRGGRYAFLEMNQRLLGESGWRLWALPGPNRKAVLLDRSDGPKGAQGPSPWIALTEDGVIWTAVHDRRGVPTYELRSARFDSSDSRALLASPVAKAQYWFPSTDPAGTHVVYATVEPDGSAFRFRTWSLDLTDRAAKPVRLGDSDEATEPVTNGTTLAWRVVDGNVANWGNGLVVAGVDGGGAHMVPASNLMKLSLGRRFLTYGTLNGTDLVVYDTQADRLVAVERHAPPDTLGMQRGWTLVAGDLLVFRRVSRSDTPVPAVVCWALLPAPGQ